MQDPALQGSAALVVLTRIAEALERLEPSISRIADGYATSYQQKVGTEYVAGQLGCTTVWVAEQARDGVIPASCIVTGTGHGKPWKFHRCKIDAWIKSR